MQFTSFPSPVFIYLFIFFVLYKEKVKGREGETNQIRIELQLEIDGIYPAHTQRGLQDEKEEEEEA